ncbi:MAG: alpha-beta hydrolase superfamily lysophospholipase [Planctomycetota bacterium]|jgi:alpha-beta hydrolase superfamily lysophospholipase
MPVTTLIDAPGAPAPNLGDAEGLFGSEPTRTLAFDDVSLSQFQLGPERVFSIEPRGGSARGIIFWVHGLTDHAARQFESATWLAKRRFRVILFELQGHGGREFGIEESWGQATSYFRLQGNTNAVAEEIRSRASIRRGFRERVSEVQFTALKRTTFDDHLIQIERVLSRLVASGRSDLPFFFCGHSMGALLCLESIRQSRSSAQTNLGGLILMAPGFLPLARPGRPAEKALIKVFQSMSNGSPLSLIGASARRVLNLDFPFDISWGVPFVSDQSAENKLVDLDPLNLRKLPSSYVSSVLSRVIEINRTIPDFLPNTLMLLPEKDSIVDIAGSEKFLEKARRAIGRSRISTARFPFLHAHNLLRSSARAQARSVILNWLEKRLDQ